MNAIRPGALRPNATRSLFPILLLTILPTMFDPGAIEACTTILVGKALTADGSVLHAHNEDMGNETVGRLWSVPSVLHSEDASLAVPYVELPQVASTLGYWASGNVQGTMGLGTSEETRAYDSVLVGLNERGVSMSCNWAHSREENRQGVGLRRYAIRQLLLERATSARHGVELLGSWIETYGQADWGGLIYHLADAEEAWIVETTTHNWVARRLRDDEIHVTANRFSIGTDYDLSSSTLVTHAVDQGWIASADESMHFARVYGREGWMEQAYDSRREARARQLLVGRAATLTPEDLFRVLRDRYEGSEHYTPPQPNSVWREDLEGLEANPSLSRTLSTNLAQSTFVAHHRNDVPVALGAVLWFGIGTPNYTGYVPLYAGGTAVTEELSGIAETWGDGSAWKLFRQLQRRGDGQYDRHQLALHASWTAEHAVLLERQRRVEAEVMERLDGGVTLQAEQHLAAFSWTTLRRATEHGRWLLQRLAP